MNRTKSQRIAKAKQAARRKRFLGIFRRYNKAAEEIAARVDAVLNYHASRLNKPTVN
jgi:hypothetical protein